MHECWFQTLARDQRQLGTIQMRVGFGRRVVWFLVLSVLDSNIYTHLCLLRFIGPGVTAGCGWEKNWGNMKGMLLVGINANGKILC